MTSSKHSIASVAKTIDLPELGELLRERAQLSAVVKAHQAESRKMKNHMRLILPETPSGHPVQHHKLDIAGTLYASVWPGRTQRRVSAPSVQAVMGAEVYEACRTTRPYLAVWTPRGFRPEPIMTPYTVWPSEIEAREIRSRSGLGKDILSANGLRASAKARLDEINALLNIRLVPWIVAEAGSGRVKLDGWGVQGQRHSWDAGEARRVLTPDAQEVCTQFVVYAGQVRIQTPQQVYEVKLRPDGNTQAQPGGPEGELDEIDGN